MALCESRLPMNPARARTYYSSLGFITAAALAFFSVYPYMSHHPALHCALAGILFGAVVTVVLLVRTVPSFAPWVIIYLLTLAPGLYWMPSYGWMESRTLLLLLQPAFFFLAAMTLRASMNQQFFASLLLALATLSALYGLYQYFHLFPAYRAMYLGENGLLMDGVMSHHKAAAFRTFLLGGRINSFFTNPNMFSGFLLAGLPLACCHVWPTDRSQTETVKHRILMAAIVSIIFLAVLLTRSRSGLALVCLLPLGLVKNFTKRLFLWMVLATMVVFLSPIILDSFRGYLPVSFVSRMDYWTTAGNILTESPLTGLGIGAFTRYSAAFSTGIEEMTSHVHNHWLERVLEVGVPAAFGAFLLLCFYPLQPLVNNARHQLVPRLPMLSKAHRMTVLFLLVLLCITLPPANFSNDQFSPLFSFILLLFGLGLFGLLSRSSGPSPPARNRAIQYGFFLLLLHSLVDFSMEKVGTSLVGFSMAAYLVSGRYGGLSRYFSGLQRSLLAISFILCMVMSFFQAWQWIKGKEALMAYGEGDFQRAVGALDVPMIREYPSRKNAILGAKARIMSVLEEKGRLEPHDISGLLTFAPEIDAEVELAFFMGHLCLKHSGRIPGIQ